MAGSSGKYGKAVANLIVIAVIVFLCVFVAPKIILLLMPFVIGWFLAILANPFVHFLEEKMKIKRKAGSALVIIGIIAGICLLLYFLGDRLFHELLELLKIVPDMWQEMKLEVVSFTRKWSGVIDDLPVEMVERAGEIGEAIGDEIGVIVGELSMPNAETISDFTGNIPSIIMAVIMCLLSAYFFVAEKDYVAHGFQRILPASWREKCLLLKKTTIDVMVGYWKAQFKIEIWIYLLVTAGLLLLKVRYGYLIAIPIAILDMLPIFGTGTILIPWTMFKILSGEYMQALGFFAIWGVSQLVRQIIQPKVIGDSLGIAPIPTLILLYVGYKLAGMIGMIVAVPFGILLLAMNEVGFFNNTKKSIRILWNGFHEFRQFAEEEWDVTDKKEV